MKIESILTQGYASFNVEAYVVINEADWKESRQSAKLLGEFARYIRPTRGRETDVNSTVAP